MRVLQALYRDTGRRRGCIAVEKHQVLLSPVCMIVFYYTITSCKYQLIVNHDMSNVKVALLQPYAYHCVARLCVLDKAMALHVIKLGSQSWTAPESLIHQDSNDQLWLQISCTNYGLCKLLCQSDVPAHPNMKSCPGIQLLLEKRSEIVNDIKHQGKPEKKLFDSVRGPPKKRAKLLETPSKLDLAVEGVTVSVKWPKKSTDDLQILLDERTITVFADFLQSKGVQFEHLAGCKRQYTKKGKAECPAEEASE